MRTIGANSPESASSASIRRRSSGNSRASIGSTSSHNDNTCPASNRNIPTPKIADKHSHLQGIIPSDPDRTVSDRNDYFRGK
jgi:hypothetical protein